jgi:hypothetical protein
MIDSTLVIFISILILTNLCTFFYSYPSANRRVRKLFRKKTGGAFVEVFLDYGFGHIVDATSGERPFPHCLHITDLSPDMATKALAGVRFDWNLIHSHWRHFLEIEGFYQVEWVEMQDYLRKED